MAVESMPGHLRTNCVCPVSPRGLGQCIRKDKSGDFTPEFSLTTRLDPRSPGEAHLNRFPFSSPGSQAGSVLF